MKRSFWYSIALSMALVSNNAVGNDKPKIHFITPEIPNLSLMDKGLYHDLLDEVYGDEYDVEIKNMPYKRAMALIQRSRFYSGILGVVDRSSNLLMPKNPGLNFEYLGVATYKNRQVNTIRDIYKSRVAWQSKYDFFDNETALALFSFIPTTSIEDGIDLLLNDRIDFLIDDYRSLKNEQLRNGSTTLKIHKLNPGSKVFIGFKPSVESERLIKVFDDRMTSLRANNSLDKIYSKWNETVPFNE